MACNYTSDDLWDIDRLNTLVPGKTFVQWTKEDLVEHVKFKTLDEAAGFYHVYSVGRGFGFRIADTKNTVQKQESYRRWKCSKSGEKNEIPDSKRVRSERKVTRCGCEATLAVKWSLKEQCYRVKNYVPHHNHTMLTSRETLTLPSNNKLTAEQRQTARDLGNAGVRPAKIMSFMANGAGGFRYLGFKVRNLYNFMNADIADQIRDGDAEAVLTYLASKVNNGDKNLYCKYTVDDDNKLCHLFWADSRSRLDFQFYKDVVLFDATYKTNGYEFPLVLIIGVNNHGQTVVFGACLMRDETTASYVWLLETFKECMQIENGPPLVLTDSDRAMIAAVRLVFGDDTMHRLCSWHIMRNFQAYVADSGFKDVFMKCMTVINTEEEFEDAWHDGIDEYGLEDNEWLNMMYEKRRLWVEFMFAPVFSAKQTTTSRSESINSFFKRFLQRKLKLYFFIISFDEGLTRLRENELDADTMNKTSTPPITRSLASVKGWQESAGALYTRAIYNLILHQIQLHVALVGNLEAVDEYDVATYSVRMPGSDSPPRTVFWDRTSQLAGCSCGFLIEAGIPCRHIFVAMKYEAVKKIPEILVLNRWTMNARNVEMPPNYTYTPTDPYDVDLRKHSRIGKMENLWVKVRDSASQTDEGYNEVFGGLQRMLIHCDEAARRCNSRPAQSGNASGGFSACSNIVRDPATVHPKGSAPNATKSKSKQAGTSTRHCSHCGQPGHDIRKCPALGGTQPTHSQPVEQDPNFYYGTTSSFPFYGDEQESQHAWGY